MWFYLSANESVNRGVEDNVFLEIPGDLSLLEPIAAYQTKRTSQAWLLSTGICARLRVALHEALANALKHGNHSDAAKQVTNHTESVDGETLRQRIREGPMKLDEVLDVAI